MIVPGSSVRILEGFLGKPIERLTASGLQVEPHDQSEHRSRFSYGWVNRLSTA